MTDFHDSFYEEYYKNKTNEWRIITSIDKSKHILDLCKISPQNCLDIGAGEGSVIIELEKNKFHQKMWAIEISNNAVERINEKRIKTLKECKRFNGYHIPYEDKFFDLSILSHVIEHVKNPEILLYDVKRVSKYIFLEIPLEDNLKLNKQMSEYKKWGHVNFYTKESFDDLLDRSGFKIIRSKVYNFSLPVYRYEYDRYAELRYYLKMILFILFPKLSLRYFNLAYCVFCETTA